ncbi:hypothetical protein [Clostridium grantii]|uniref:Uncharacterized protein n=1 Tax=Clostridium grantii DSM 8605 TaxID=1121316 RepID=A0A1M5R0N2_9CLOT|nr:hypothetical protein [Clostridium grantii]SHH19935.1 hypothetical protein SAMN02745207_00413 [Clostridium grantii DSM 8605]
METMLNKILEKLTSMEKTQNSMIDEIISLKETQTSMDEKVSRIELKVDKNTLILEY